MKRLLIIVVVVLLGGALVFLNQGVRKSAMPDKDDDDQAQQSPASAAPKTPATPTDPKGVLPAEETVGNPAAPHHIEVGWVYNEANQGKPVTLNAPIGAIRDYVNHCGGIASAEIVNLDVPIEDRTPAAQAVTALGIRVDGQTLFGGNISDLPFSPNAMTQNIESAYKKQ